MSMVTEHDGIAALGLGVMGGFESSSGSSRLDLMDNNAYIG